MMTFRKLFKLTQWHTEQRIERSMIISSFENKIRASEQGTRNGIFHAYSMRTLRLLSNYYNDQETANAVYNWVNWSSTNASEDELRELVAFGLPYREAIGKRMLMFAIERTKVAYPRFFYEDLSEMNSEESAAFKEVFAVLISVYLSRRESWWKPVEDADWNHSYYFCWEEAEKAFPVASEPLVELIMNHADRSDDIAQFIIQRGVNVADKDASHLESYLELDALALSAGSL